MQYPQFNRGTAAILSAVALASFVTGASADMNIPTEHRFLSAPLQICDQGLFYIGGAPKITAFGGGPTAGAPRQIIIGDMYVHFQVPMKTRKWPLIMVHGSTYLGTCVEGRADGGEGWADWTVRHNISTYVVDQAGRGRSGWDKSIINEAESLIATDPARAAAMLPSFAGSDSSAWASFFGHIIPAGTDVVTGTMIRHGAPGDPTCVANPDHCAVLSTTAVPDDPHSWDFDIEARVNAIGPTPNPANYRNLAAEVFKFNVPNTEATLPSSTCPACVPTTVSNTNTWTPRALAKLVERLGGAIVATHSQSGSMGHHMVRILKEHGNLSMLKGLITIEGGAAVNASTNLTPADFKNIPYLQFSGYYAAVSGASQAVVDAINAAGGTAEYIHLNDPAFGGQFKGTSHMMMIEKNNLEVMDVMLDWANTHISNPPSATKCPAN